ncbi:MAG: DUF1540 domain-containing protein [Cellulosilyticaceae bacterium]
MTSLNCSVTNCANNSEGCCCRSKIDVSGVASSENTCCTDFTEFAGVCNLVETAQLETIVDCHAIDCAHNENSECQAQSINMTGMGANNSKDTNCGSYCHQ